MHKKPWPTLSKDRFILILTLTVLVSALTGCAGWRHVGDLEINELPEEVQDPCPHPLTLLQRGGTVGDDEISLGRIGDALIECGAEKDIAVQGYSDLRAVLVQ